ncbi:protein Hook homolog 3 isoform X2 [Ascaphus truei]|uniref:protein Hook homolog 3 isoform X2 n=1 Tax=Ascaphus truei TaxID=8439 RepID=UPI003F5AD886
MAMILQKIDAAYFDENWLHRIKTDVGDNWRLKILGQQINDFTLPDVNLVGEHSDASELGRMLQLILGCAVKCEQKQEYIQTIMMMEESVQHMVMTAIQELMSKESPVSIGNDAYADFDRQLKKTTEELNEALTAKEEIAQRCHELDMQEEICIDALTSLLRDSDSPSGSQASLDNFERATNPTRFVEGDLDEDCNIRHSPFKPKSVFFPYQSKGGFVETFYSLVLRDFESMCAKLIKFKPNLTKGELGALGGLKINHDIVIRQADKGGGIVIQDLSAYLTEARRLLGDSASYTLLESDPVDSYQLLLKELLTSALGEGIISKAEFKFLFCSHPRTPIFYHLPKVHKSLSNPPGRPIVSGVESMTSTLSQYVDYFLHPYVTALRSHIRDTLHVIDSISDIRWKSTYLWATCDVSSLYTCIEHTKGLEAIKYWLDKDPLFPEKHRLFILESIHFILTHNYFLFEDDFHLQICGTAMGTRFAPSYANLFMGHWEESHVWQNILLGAGLVYYGRFIDDIIIIWDGEESELFDILSSFSNNSFGLKFTFDINNLSTVFLDLALSIDTDLNIITTTHFKSVSVNSYVHASSNHHKHWLNNIPLGQFHRIRRNCTRDVDFENQSVTLGKKFLSKGYDPVVVSDSLSKVSSIARTTLLEKSKNKLQKGKRSGYDIPATHTGTERSNARFITTYNQSSRSINRILNDHWSILKCDPHLGPILPDRATVTYRKARSIKSILAPTRLKSSSICDTAKNKGPLGNHPCGRSRCITCRHLLNNTHVCSQSRGIIRHQ